MFEVQWSSASDNTYLICYVTSENYVIKGYRWELLIVCYHPTMFGGHRQCGIGDMFLICHVIY